MLVMFFFSFFFLTMPVRQAFCVADLLAGLVFCVVILYLLKLDLLAIILMEGLLLLQLIALTCIS